MSRTIRILVGVAAAGLAGACAGGPGPGSAEPVFATTTTAAPPAVTAPPAAVPSPTYATPAPTFLVRTRGTTTRAPSNGGGGSSADWTRLDFAKIMFTEIGCKEFPETPKTAPVAAIRYADLTGDGRTEAVVAAACYTSTGPNPVTVTVFDGADTKAPLKPMVTFGEGQDLVDAELSLNGKEFTVFSRALGPRAARCCPDVKVTQTYGWNGSEFKRLRLETGPLVN